MLLREFHHRVEHRTEHRLVQLRAFAHFTAAELNSAFQPGVIGALVAQERSEVAHLERLGKVLVIVQGLRAAGLHVEHLQIEALGAIEPIPVGFGDARRHEALVGRVDSEGNEPVDKGGFALDARADGLGRHVSAVDHGIARQHTQRSGITCHLNISVLEDVLVR